MEEPLKSPEVKTETFLAIQSKLRHFESLSMSLIIIKLLNLNSSKKLILEHFYRVFSASNTEEVRLLLNAKRTKMNIFRFSIKRSIFVGMAIRINIGSGKALTGIDNLVFSILARFVQIEHRVLVSRIPDLQKSFLKKSYSRLDDIYRKFITQYSTKKIHFTKLSEVDDNYFVTSKGLIFDYNSNLYINDPSVNSRSVTNAGLHGLLVRPSEIDHVVYFHQNENKIVKVNTSPILFLGSRCSENYWHFLIEDASRLLRFKLSNENLKIHSIILPTNATRVAREIVHAIYPNIQIIEISEHEYIAGNKILIPESFLTLDDEPRLGIQNTFYYEKQDLINLRERFVSVSRRDRETFGKRIYIKRKSEHRLIEGEDRLIEYLKLVNFTIIDLALFDFQDQVRIFQNAELLIGAAGAAWANLIFAQRNIRVLSLIGQDAAPWDMHRVIAEDFDLDYSQKLLTHSKRKELFYTNYLHRNVKILERDIQEILAWIDFQQTSHPKKD
jgi:capsular polysaccharide biosynthesis protein